MPPPTLDRRVARLESGQRDQTERLNQVRRAMGFNGKVDDPEVEADIAAGFRELALLAKNRREHETVEQAKATLRSHYATRWPALVTVGNLARRKLVWTVTAVLAAFYWGFGNHLSSAVASALHAHHLFGF